MEETVVAKENKIIVKYLKYIFFILTVLMIVGIIWGVYLLNLGVTSDYWSLTILLPIAILEIIYARKIQKTNYKHLGEISFYIGIISFILFLFMTIMMVLFSRYEKKDFDLVNRIEEIIGFELPNQGRIITRDFTASNYENSRYKTLSKVFFEDDVNDLEIAIVNSDKWTSTLSQEASSAIPRYLVREDANYYLLYDIDNDIYNSSPIEVVNNYILIYYYDNGEATIIEYSFEIEEG